MNRKIGLVVLAVTTLGLATACSPANTDAAEREVITLTFGVGLPAQHVIISDLAEPWLERVEELTDGQVEFDMFVGGELVETGEEEAALNAGTIDMGMLHPPYATAQYPLGGVSMLPLSDATSTEASSAYLAMLNGDDEFSDGTTFKSQFTDKGFHVWPTQLAVANRLATVDKQPYSVDTIKKLSLRVSGQVPEMYAANVGYSTVTLPGQDMFDAVSRGAIDGTTGSTSDWVTYGLHDTLKYAIADLDLGHFASVFAIPLDTWNKLPENVQDAMEQAFEETYMDGTQALDDAGEAAVAKFEQAGGEMKSLAEIDPDARDRYLSAVTDTWMDFIDDLEANGHPGKEVALLWRDHLVEAGADVPDGIMSLK
ncbi:TRAP transporter substrate-binding protein DctP [Arthrobacter sulfonylureivorans]|uniref:TRAP transporter substrate-binding protein DctP n=1 Tax=Arthrobacter sulfonylureivorans TaxID=2486855 RepID=A0ABY3WC34_9MICC|nr:TRAP transporter substrate-binding protein DctP [Arthrobacter sulfonylureivorans]UNK47880.1 TRAP transporter substrate-binding protein DctP [Arthrobacter sulfonylureivorans]